MIDLQILKKQNNLTVSDDGLIYVKPEASGGWITYPLEELAGCLALTPEEYVLLKAGYYTFNETLTGLEISKPNEEEIKEEFGEIGQVN